VLFITFYSFADEFSTQRVHGSINEAARHTICSYAERVGEFTLTDDVRCGEVTLSPSVFLCLAQLQNPLKPLFPNLRRLRIINAHYSLDYLRLFLSPSLDTIEFIGLGESCRATLLSFLSAAVVEVPNLSTLILGPGRLSRDVVDACLGFSRLKRLELADVIFEADYQLLKDVGRLEHLETFIIDAQGVGYAPSQALIQAEEEERARAIAEEEHRHQKIEEEEQERRRKFEEEVEERRRKGALPRVKGKCWMCGKQFKKGMRTQCSSCSSGILEQEKYMQELDDERCRMIEYETRKEVEERMKAEEEEKKRCEEAAEEQKRCEAAVAEYEKRKEEEDLYWSEAESKYQESVEEDERMVNTDREGVDVSATSRIPEADDDGITQASIDRQEDSELRPKFPKLLNLTVRGSTEMMQDVVELITSESVVLLCLDIVPAQSSPLSSIAIQRFVGTVNSALRRWASSIAYVTLSGLPNVASKLPDKTVEALVYLPHLESLELNGWDVTSNIADYFCSRLWDIGISKLKVLHLSDDSSAISIPLPGLDSIAKACPNLLTLRCRLENLLGVPNHSSYGSKLLSHSLETLTVGDSNQLLDFKAMLKVARYIDNLFPKVKDIKPLEGTAQNPEQWRHIEELVKFRQSGWLDRIHP